MSVATWFRTLAASYLIDHQNKSMAMNRAQAAQQSGLDPSVYGIPLPGSNSTTTTINNARGWLWGALCSALLLAAGLFGGPLLGKMLSPAGAVPAQPAAPAPQAPAAPDPMPTVTPNGGGAQEWVIIKQQQPDGTWKEIGRWKETKK